MCVVEGVTCINIYPTPVAMNHMAHGMEEFLTIMLNWSSGLLSSELGSKVSVNSTISSGVEHAGSLVVTGRAPSGLIEASEKPSHRFSRGSMAPRRIDQSNVLSTGQAARVLDRCQRRVL